jgi:hypothetical protein
MQMQTAVDELRNQLRRERSDQELAETWEWLQMPESAMY